MNMIAEHEYTANVQVSVGEMLSYGHHYEHFVDLLRDKLRLLDDVSYRVIVHEYHMVALVRQDVGMFRIRWELEDA